MTGVQSSDPFAAPGALHFVPLGGVGEIGMNTALLGCDGKWLMIDLGVAFADETLPGIDLLTPDPAFIAERRADLVGLVLTHAHEDHLGAVAHIWPRLGCPVHATPFAAEILRHKLAEFGLADEVPVHVVAPGERLALDPFGVTYVGVTHSIPEPNALAIETPAGLVVHSGDWKLDPDPQVGSPVDEAALRRLGKAGVLALLCDSTNAHLPGSSGSEADLFEGLSALVADRSGRVAVTTFASNVARIRTVAAVAAAHGRRLCIAGRSLWRTIEAARRCGHLDGTGAFLSERDVGYLPRREVLLLCTGCQGEPRGALARIAGDEHPHVSLEAGDRVIFSSKIIPGNERPLARLHDRLVERGIDVITERTDLVHVSGHPARDDLRRLYGWLRPRIAVPVHGERIHLTAHARLAREMGVPEVLSATNGDVLRLAPGPAARVGRVPAGRLAVDGDRLVPPDDEALKARRRLMHNGAALVTLVADAAGGLIGDPRIALHGLPLDGAAGDLERAIVAAIAESVAGLAPAAARRDEPLANAARQGLRRAIRAACGKRPVTEVQVVRLSAEGGARPPTDGGTAT